jgi:hypothetical protein
MVAGCVISARRVMIPSRGLMGWRSIATIFTSFRGCNSDVFSSSGCACCNSAAEGSIPCILSSNCLVFSCLSSHTVRPNFSPLISTRDRTWLQLPGAAQRSTTRVTPAKRSNSRDRSSVYIRLGYLVDLVSYLHLAAEACMHFVLAILAP